MSKRFFLFSFLVTSVSCVFAYSNIFETYHARVDLLLKGGSKRQIGQFSLLQPITQTPDSLMYIDLVGMTDLQKNSEGNFGLGYRHKFKDFILGGYGFYDLRSTRGNNKVHQATLGLEFMQEFLELRGNLYYPFTGEKLISGGYGSVNKNGANVVVKYDGNELYEYPMKGFDLEVGGNLPFHPNLSLYSAYYCFTHKDVETIHGGRARGNYQLMDWLSLMLEYSYDNNRKHNVLAGAQFSWSFDAKSRNYRNNSLMRKMTYQPVRDIDIRTAEKKFLRPKEQQTHKNTTAYLIDPSGKFKGDRVVKNINDLVEPFSNKGLDGIIYFTPDGRTALHKFEELLDEAAINNRITNFEYTDRNDKKYKKGADSVAAFYKDHSNKEKEEAFKMLVSDVQSGRGRNDGQNVHQFDGVMRDGGLYNPRNLLLEQLNIPTDFDRSILGLLRALRTGPNASAERVANIIYNDVMAKRAGKPNSVDDGNSGIDSSRLFAQVWGLSDATNKMALIGSLADIHDTDGYCSPGRVNRLFINLHTGLDRFKISGITAE